MGSIYFSGLLLVLVWLHGVPEDIHSREVVSAFKARKALNRIVILELKIKYKCVNTILLANFTKKKVIIS